MNIKATLNYQVDDYKKSLPVYYGVILALLIIFGGSTIYISMKYSDNSGYSSFSGFDTAAAIFLFSMAISTFKSGFLMLLQNGISRRSTLVSRILSHLGVAAVMMVIDLLLRYVTEFIFSLFTQNVTFATTFEATYFMSDQGITNVSPLYNAAYLFLFYLALLSLGTFIALLYYRMNTILKVLVSAGVPITVFIVLPIIDYNLTGGKLTIAIGKFLDFAFGFSTCQPWHAMITFVIGSIVLYFLSWLLIRRAEIKK